MIKVRTVFEKKGRAKYISHLDLNRFMMRAFRRSGLPIWYTEGFNPHPYVTFALALSLGFESSCEIMDFNLNEGVAFAKVKRALNDVMPEGIQILSVTTPQRKVTDIAKAEYTVEYICEDTEKMVSEIDDFMKKDEILIEKKTKKGMKTVDIKPVIEICDIRKKSDRIFVDICLPAGTQNNFNPSLFTDALKSSAEISFETGKISRNKILCENNEIFF